MQVEGPILMTGAWGFAGRHLSEALGRAFPGVRKVAISQNGSRLNAAGWECVQADIAVDFAVDSVVAEVRPRLVVHLAAQSSVGQAELHAETTWRTNMIGTWNMARAVARHAPEAQFFFTSSAEVYGMSFNVGVVREDSPPMPLNSYSSSKLSGEHVLRDILSSRGRLVVARSFNHTGPGQDERFVLPAFASQIARIEACLAPPVLRCGNLDAERDFLDVRDVTDAYCRLIQLQEAPRQLLVNIASGTTARIGDLLEKLRGLSRRDFAIEMDPARLRPSDIPRAVGDPARLRNLTGWAPVHSTDEMLQGLLDYWRGRIAEEHRGE